MKRIILAAGLFLAAPVSASTILPNLYAETFCSLRSAGVSAKEATAAAVRDSLIPTDDWTYVTVNGRRMQSDVALAIMATARRCPGAF